MKLGLKRIIGVLTVSAFFGSSGIAYSWGMEGHHTVGAIADTLIRKSNAGTRVASLLKKESLEKYAIWMDCAKGYCKDWFDDEMKKFVHANRKHHDYHFTDIPIQEIHYLETSVGASDDDIVRIMQQCISVLRGNTDPVVNPNKYSERIALILLAHLVGDIHQPLHVGAVYVGPKETFVNPNSITGKYVATQGGNYLLTTQTVNLHSYWDSSTVKRAMSQLNAKTPATFARALVKQKTPALEMPDDIGNAPVLWAEESLQLAAKAFNGVELGPRFTAHDRQGDKGHLEWEIDKKPAGYNDFARDAASDQIKLAGYRLAALLKAIWP